MSEQPLPLSPKHVDILAQELLHGRLVLFIGAGLSRLAPAKDGSDQRLPLWQELTEQVAQTCQEEPADYNSDPLDLFDAVVYGQQRFKLEQAVRAALDDKAFHLSPAHEALKELPWAAVVTTNYDGLLQRLLDEEPVYEERDYDRLTLPPGQRPRLFQIHGTLRLPHTLTRDDYRLWPERHPRAYRHLEQLVLEKTVLFVGYSLSDPHLDSLLAVVKKITAGREKRLYAWMWRLPDGKVRLLDRRDKIEAISMKREEEWATAFRQLHAALSKVCSANSPVAGKSTPPQRTGLHTATAHYLSYLQDRYQYLSLKGMGLSERVPLQLPLLALYVPLQARLELPSGETWNRSKLWLAGRMLSEEEQEALTGRLSEPRPVLGLLQQRDGLVILGDPGAGKTTFLKYLTLKLTRGESAELGLGERLPILAPLSGYANALEKGDIRLDDFIAGYFHDIGSDLPLKALLTEALERGAALVLLDGLDEVQDNRWRHLVVERVVEFYTWRRKAGNKFVITSRLIGYREVRPVATGLAECTLVDFDDEEIKTFVDRWTQALEQQAQGDTRLAQADAERERSELLEAVERNAGVRQLAANPLLLTILALMKRQGVTLPERRVELYDQYVRTLLSTWNRARGLGRPPTKDLDPVQTIKILAPLALWMHETNPGVGLVKQADLCRQLKTIYGQRSEPDPESCADQFLKDVRQHAGLLLERGPREYGFIHLTFEEYLAAVAIALQGQGQIDAIVTALVAHVGEPVWHEIGLLTVGYLGLIQQLDTIAGGVVETLVKKQPGPAGAAVVLAGEAAIDVGAVGIPPASRERVIATLVETMQQDRAVLAETRCRAGRALATLGDPRPGVSLNVNGLPELLWVRIPGTATVRESGRFPNFTELRLGNGVRPDPEARDDEQWPTNARPLAIAEFELAVYPLTVAQFRPFVAQGYREDRWWSAAGRRDRGKRTQPYLWDDPVWRLDNHPVVGVTWYDAEAFCNWLNEQLHWLPGTIRLPTEAEWEWAARGPEGRRYPWGDDWESGRCNSDESGINRTSAVGCFPGGAVDGWWQKDWPTEAVLYDLAGNVWEWTVSEYSEDYLAADKSVLNANPGGPGVLRGGSWHNEP